MKHTESASGAREPGGIQSADMMISLLDAARALEDRLEQALAAVGLSLAKQGVLTTLARSREPLALSDLASHQRCVRSNITQLVDRLEAEGLVRRVDHPQDRRSIRAEITPLGKGRQAAGAAAFAKVQAQFSASLTKGQRSALARMLATLS